MVKLSLHKEKMDRKKIWFVSFLSLLMGLISSSLIYVTSDYIKRSTGLEHTGSFYVVAYIVVFLILFYFHRIVNRIGKIRLFLYIQLLKIGILSVLVFLPDSYSGAVLLSVYMVFSYLTWVEMDSILESFSIDRMSGRIRGLYLFMSNIGYMIGVFSVTQILDKYSFSGVFLFTMIVSAMLFTLTLIKLKNIKENLREVLSPQKLVKKVFHNKDVFNIYLVSISLEIFYAVVVVYVPLYLIYEIGFNWSQVGVMFVFSQIPYLLLQYPAGYLADKKFGEKELLIFAILLTSLSTFCIYFISSASVFAWTIIMILIRVGPSIFEIMKDSYFYKKVDGRDLDMIDFFRTSGPIGVVFGTLVSLITLSFFEIKTIFILSGFLIIMGIFPAMKLADNFSEQEVKLGKGEIRFRNRFGFLGVLGRNLRRGLGR